MKPKFEVQDAHFLGKQYSLHCSIVEPGTHKYFDHLSDNTTHDLEFAHKVLVDLFDKLSIKNETMMIKSDNASTQYKNKYAFNSMQTLSNNYDIKIIRIYGAAGHRKGLIDAMSRCCVKSILLCDIVGLDQWFADSKEVCQYLRFRKEWFTQILTQRLLTKGGPEKKAIKIKGCILGHLLVYEPNSAKILMKEYLCDYESCLNLEFTFCKKPFASVGEIGDDFLEECMVDEDDDW